MKMIVRNIIIILHLCAFFTGCVYANVSEDSVSLVQNAKEMNNFEKAENLIRKAQLARNQEESYEYVHKARVIYEEDIFVSIISIDCSNCGSPDLNQG